MSLSLSCLSIQASVATRRPQASGYKLRRVRPEDIPRVSELCYDAFKDSDRGFLSPAGQSLPQWEAQYTRALSAKKRAVEEFFFLPIQQRILVKESIMVDDPRRSRQQRYIGQDGSPRRPMPRILRKLQILVVEERSSGVVVGCASLSMARCESALPPPFPTGKPYRCYASNIVVDRSHRRNGLGSLLVEKCERIAGLWGESSLWLHVEEDNTAAVSLYDNRSYKKMDYFALYGNGKTELRAKSLPKRSSGGMGPVKASLGDVNESKVFVWK
jgi:ribosomal protein S18 acetylase RimI-like enzyme